MVTVTNGNPRMMASCEHDVVNLCILGFQTSSLVSLKGGFPAERHWMCVTLTYWQLWQRRSLRWVRGATGKETGERDPYWIPTESYVHICLSGNKCYLVWRRRENTGSSGLYTSATYFKLVAMYRHMTFLKQRWHRWSKYVHTHLTWRTIADRCHSDQKLGMGRKSISKNQTPWLQQGYREARGVIDVSFMYFCISVFKGTRVRSSTEFQ